MTVKLSVWWSQQFRQSVFKAEWVKAFGGTNKRPKPATRTVAVITVGPDGKEWN